MGIGNLYATVLNNLGHGVITVDLDPAKGAEFLTVEDAIAKCHMFDTVHVCTPNFTHYDIAAKVAPVSKIVFIEKPGVATRSEWQQLVESFPQTRFMMVKNNMWRSNIDELADQANNADTVDIMWMNQDRVPNPGTWFTTKKLAFGGVSRDLMPHLLSLYIAFNPSWRKDMQTSYGTKQNWRLNQLTKTDYGTVKADGVYDVDDECYITFTHKWNLVANWRTNDFDTRGILFRNANGDMDTFDLDLCPEDAYQAMIKECVDKVNDPDFWRNQYEIDLWIHEIVEKL